VRSPPAAIEIPEIWRRIAVTLGALVIYRLGSHLPLPGLDLRVVNEAIDISRGGVGAFSRPFFPHLSIFAVGITPYLSASFCLLLVTAASRWARERIASRKDFDRLTRLGAVALAAVGGYAVAIGLESAGGARSVVPELGASFPLVTTATLVAGTVFLMWLADEITRRGIGNGVALLLFSDIVVRLPSNMGHLIERGRAGALPSRSFVLPIALLVATATLIVFMERARRRLVVQYRPRLVGTTMFEGEGARLQFKVNNFGVIPASVAGMLLLIPATIYSMTRGGWLAQMVVYLRHGSPIFILCFGGLIVLLAFLYTALIFSPKDMARRLQDYGGAIAGHEPGTDTAAYLDYMLTRLTLVGAVYLAAVCVLPDLLSLYNLPFYFGGTTLLVLVCVALDLQDQVRAHLGSRG
jgi:preprotein translocase subunit SecY